MSFDVLLEELEVLTFGLGLHLDANVFSYQVLESIYPAELSSP
jgi:hypothetical protein